MCLFPSLQANSLQKFVHLILKIFREDLLEALICSCFLPAFSGYRVPTFRGEKFLDGCLSINLPVLDSHTIKVSPFAGLDKDICPRFSTSSMTLDLQGENIALNLENLKRGIHVIKASNVLVLEDYYSCGLKDAKTYFEQKTS